MNNSTARDLLLQGQTHLQQGRFTEAERICRQVADDEPDNAAAHQLLGLACFQLGRHQEAISAMRRSIALDPKVPAYFGNLGTVCCSAGDYEKGVEYHRRSVELNPAMPGYLANLGDALRLAGHCEEAIDMCRRALALRPDDANAWNNLGAALREMGKNDDAIESMRRAVSLKPDQIAAWSNLCAVLMHYGSTEDVIDACRESLKRRPDQMSLHSDLLMSLLYLDEQDEREIYREHLRWIDSLPTPPPPDAAPHGNDRSPDRRLRIGYVSPDFREHSVAFFIEPVLGASDHQQFEVLCYSINSTVDGVTERLRGLADQWHDITKLSDDAAAELIRRHGVDILVDLAGHTAGNRLGLFVRQPAPVQVSYLGYPATTGLAAMGYRLSSTTADPPGLTDDLYAEQLLRLSESFLCYRPPDAAPDVAPPSCLASGHITFGCFNQFAKINANVMHAWSQILLAIPGSRLLLKNRALEDEGVRRRLLQSFSSLGIDGGRLDLRPRDLSFEHHMATYHQVDIALDTFPYNGTTTTFEAIWMGVPVIGLTGNVHRGRVALSILSALGLPDLVAPSPAQYVQAAVGLARDQQRLQQLRQTLRARLQGSILTDAGRFTRQLEDAYRQMWARWCAR